MSLQQSKHVLQLLDCDAITGKDSEHVNQQIYEWRKSRWEVDGMLCVIANLKNQLTEIILTVMKSYKHVINYLVWKTQELSSQDLFKGEKDKGVSIQIAAKLKRNKYYTKCPSKWGLKLMMNPLYKTSSRYKMTVYTTYKRKTVLSSSSSRSFAELAHNSYHKDSWSCTSSSASYFYMHGCNVLCPTSCRSTPDSSAKGSVFR